MEIQTGDRVTGWFGTGVVTDVAYGFLVDQITEEQYTGEDDIVLIEQNGKTRVVYRTDIKEIL